MVQSYYILPVMWLKGSKACVGLFVDPEGTHNNTNVTTPACSPFAVTHSGLLRASNKQSVINGLIVTYPVSRDWLLLGPFFCCLFL